MVVVAVVGAVAGGAIVYLYTRQGVSVLINPDKSIVSKASTSSVRKFRYQMFPCNDGITKYPCPDRWSQLPIVPCLTNK